MATASVSPFVKPIGIAASVIAIVQGIVWIVLALCVVLIHLRAWKPNEDSSTYGQTLSTAIVSLYMTGGAINVYIGPTQLFTWAILYIIVSIIWTSISVFQLYALMENHAVIKLVFFGWATCTTVVCFCDLVLASLLASDYNYAVEMFNIINGNVIQAPSQTYAILASGVMMTLAARGFVLWVVNVALTGIVMKLAIDFPKKVPENGYIHPNSANAHKQPNLQGQGHNNPTYNAWKTNKSDFNRSNLFDAASFHPTPERLPQLPPIRSTNERLTKIGKQGAKPTPHNVAPPKLPQSYIYPTQPRFPGPDYSPPHSPLYTPLTSALKNRTENLYGYSNNRY